MSRIAAQTDTIIVKPSNNIFTALSAGAVVALVLALVCLYMRYTALVGPLF